MSVKTDAELSDQAEVIRDETAIGGNTKNRVYQMFQDVIDSKQSVSEPMLIEWDFATSGASPGDYPVDLNKIYVATDDSVYIAGTWFGYGGTQWWSK